MLDDYKECFSENTRTNFDSRDWYLAQLKPNGYDRAVLNLNRQGYPTFMPLREGVARRNGKIVSACKPLFPGYVFTQVCPEQQNWRAINNTYGVARVVSLQAGRPAQVPCGLMEALYDRTDDDGLMIAPQSLKCGDTVRIIAGPFVDHIAQIEKVDESERVTVLMGLMGRSVRTQITSRQVELSS